MIRIFYIWKESLTFEVAGYLLVLMQNLRKSVFFPPFLLLLISAILSLLIPEQFLNAAKFVNNSILQNFGWLFSWGVLLFLIVLMITYFSPLRKVKIGGKQAEPILTRWQWFSITLCTTIATGILFWGIAEPMYHVHAAPASIDDSRTFAMSMMFMHWTVSPYGIYTLAGLVFALCFYNLKQPFAVSSLLYPLMGARAHGLIGKVTDAICLFALVSGMAASLGAGIMSISGGLYLFFDFPPGRLIYGIIGLVIVLAFVISAATGLKKGIRILSVMNIRFFFVFAAFVFFTGPTYHMLTLGWNGLIDFFQNFIPRSAGLDENLDDVWVQSWTVFYWANWLAWTPITALFLGRIAVGYTVKDFIHFNLVLPSLFSALWMVIFSGTTIALDTTFHHEMYQSLQRNGPQSVIYQVMERLPFAGISSFVFLFIVFISYVTAADSNTSAMTGISVKGISPDSPEAPLNLKIIWGTLVGLISWIMISFAGIDGIKMISNLGGFPALLLVILVGMGLIRMIWSGRGLE